MKKFTKTFYLNFFLILDVKVVSSKKFLKIFSFNFFLIKIFSSSSSIFLNFFYHKTTKKLLEKGKKENGRKIDSREGFPRVDRKLARPQFFDVPPSRLTSEWLDLFPPPKIGKSPFIVANSSVDTFCSNKLLVQECQMPNQWTNIRHYYCLNRF